MHDGTDPSTLKGRHDGSPVPTHPKPLEWMEDGGQGKQMNQAVNSDMIGSTGRGLGHLSDVHAIGRSNMPERHHRFPKTIVA